MTLQQTVSNILGKDVTIEFAMEFANKQFGTLISYVKRNHKVSVSSAKETLENAGYFGITWTLPDIIERAKSDGFKITKKQAKKIADNIDSSHDCEYGITWLSVSDAIEMFCDENNINRKDL